MKISFPSFFKKINSKNLNKDLDQELEQFVAKRINADDSNGKTLSHENELLKNLAGLRGITASDVMVPRVDIVSVAMSDNFNEIVKQLIKTNHSRVPVRNESLDDIVGILHIKDVLANLFQKEKQNIKTLLKKPIFVSPSISLLDLLYEMRIKRRHLALVVDEYGGIDGLVHLSDISWSRISHPSDVLEIGKKYEFKILRVSDDSDKISLGYKQLKDDPWEKIENKITLNEIYDGKITHITDYGAFVQLTEKDLEGLVHSNDISWTKKNIHPNKILEVGFNIRVKVLEIDKEKKRISLGIKQTEPNPWENILNEYKKDQIIDTEIKNITEFGIFAKLNENIDGLIHKNDLSWTDSNGDRTLKKYQKGQRRASIPKILNMKLVMLVRKTLSMQRVNM